MRRLFSFLLISIAIVSCTEQAAPQPNLGKHSIAVGDYIYTLIAGDQQTGYPGHILPEGVKILITDLKGQVVARPLQFELSDKSGRLFYLSGLNVDTVSINWTLGCELQEQFITVKESACDQDLAGCTDAEIFTIKATVAEQAGAGWYTQCNYFEDYDLFYNAPLLVNDERFLVVFEENLYSTTAILGAEWIKLESAVSNQTKDDYHLLANGEVYVSGTNPKIANWSEGIWENISLPISNDDYSIVVAENGTYFLISAGGSEIYSSQDLKNWSIAADLAPYLENATNSPKAIAADGNDLYMLDGNSLLLKMNAESTEVTTYDFPHNSYGHDFQLHLAENNLFLFHPADSLLSVFNIPSKSSSAFVINQSYHLVKSNNDIYLMNGPSEILKWEGASFNLQEYANIDGHFNFFPNDKFNMFKGTPIFMNYGAFYYYTE